jgi:hypothetical protein
MKIWILAVMLATASVGARHTEDWANRGAAKLGRRGRAIADYTKAIEADSKFAKPNTAVRPRQRAISRD